MHQQQDWLGDESARLISRTTRLGDPDRLPKIRLLQTESVTQRSNFVAGVAAKLEIHFLPLLRLPRKNEIVVGGNLPSWPVEFKHGYGLGN